MKPAVLEARNLHCTFSVGGGGVLARKRQLRAVNGVSLRIETGTILGLVGESGCGKSTLVKMLLGLLKPSGGDILLDGQPMAGFSQRQISRRIQPIFQDPYSSLNPRKPIGAIISLPLRVHGVGTRETRQRKTRQIMEMVGLPSRLYNSYPNQLSGGQRQRVAIARALVMEPEVVICDEPTSALDVSVQSQILNLLQDLQKELRLTYILVSHDLAVVEHMATRVAVMYLGRIVEEAATERLFREPHHPYTQALLHSVLTPEHGRGIPETHLGITFPNPLDPPAGCTFHPRCAHAMPICSKEPPHPLRPAPDSAVECHLYDEAAPTDRPAAAAYHSE